MYRDKLKEIIRARGFSIKQLSALSGVSVDTIDSILDTDAVVKYSPRISTLEQICAPLGVDVWTLFYSGSENLVELNTTITLLEAERDALRKDLKLQVEALEVIRDVLKEQNEELKSTVESLKDELLESYREKLKTKRKI